MKPSHDRVRSLVEGAPVSAELAVLPPSFSNTESDASALALFKRGASLLTQTLPGGTIPSHDGAGSIHTCFAIDREELPRWESRLEEQGLKIEGRTTWDRGGESIYFRDPDRHLLEMMTPGNWRTYR